MPAEPRHRQKDSLDELLSNFEFARIKEYVDKRSREEAQAQMTVKPVGTVQHCSPCLPNPDMPPDVCFNLENEVRIELEELKSSSAGTDLNTLGQQCPPNEGIRETGRTTTSGTLTAGRVQAKIKIFRQARERLQASLRQLQPRDTADSRHSANKTSNSTPVGGERRHRLGTRLHLYFFFWGEAWRLLVCASSLCLPCVFFLFFRNYFPFTGKTYQRS